MRRREHSKWFYLRIVCLAVSVLAALVFDKLIYSEFSVSDSPTLTFVPVLVGLCAFAVIFVPTLQLLNPRADLLSWGRDLPGRNRELICTSHSRQSTLAHSAARS